MVGTSVMSYESMTYELWLHNINSNEILAQRFYTDSKNVSIFPG